MMIARMLVLIGCLLGALCGALAVDQLAVFYDGGKELPAKVTLGDWGFLPRPPTPDPAANPFKPLVLGRKWYALKITSLGRYQGARFDFETPLDTAPFNNVKNTYLQLYLRSVEDKKTGDGGVGGESYTSAAITSPKPGEIVTPPPAPLPGPDGIVHPPVPDGAPVDLPDEMKPPLVKPNIIPMPDFKNLRFTFITEKGPALLEVKPEQLHPVDEGKWEKVEIPLTMFNAKLPLGSQLSRLLITSDEPVEMYVGRIVIVQDNTPLTVTTFIYPNFLEAGQRIYFAARVSAGLSQYEVRWDFDTKAGPSIDAVGERVTHVFDTEGNYTITCTVVDKNGGKEPVSATMDVKVSRALTN